MCPVRNRTQDLLVHGMLQPTEPHLARVNGVFLMASPFTLKSILFRWWIIMTPLKFTCEFRSSKVHASLQNYLTHEGKGWNSQVGWNGMEKTCRECVQRKDYTQNFPFFHLLLTAYHHNLPKWEQTHLSAHSSNLCLIHAGFCYNISKWSPSKVLHHYKQFVSHQVTKKTHTQNTLTFLYFLNTWYSWMLKNSKFRHLHNKTRKLIALRARKTTGKLLWNSTEK